MKLNKFFFIFIIGIGFNLFADNYLPLTDTESGNVTLVHHAVNVISGDYIENVNDITLLGPEPLIFQRLYSSSDYRANMLYDGWRHNHESYMHFTDSKKGLSAYYIAKNGGALPFEGRISKNHLSHLKFFQKKAKGYTNYSSGSITGAAHAKNIKLTYDKAWKNAKVRDGAGNISSFYKFKNKKKKLYLVREEKPNGNEIRYIYHKDGDLSQIQTLNKNRKMFSWLKFVDPAKKEFKKNPNFEIHTSDGRKVLYKLQTFKEEAGVHKYKNYRINEVVSSDKPTIGYQYRYKDEDRTADVHISQKNMPNGRFLAIDYHRRGYGTGKKDFYLNRVKRLKAPSGHDNQPVEIYRFDYVAHLKKEKILSGYTNVKDANNRLMRYSYTEDHRIEHVQKFRGNNDSNYFLYSLEKYIWDKEGSLKARFVHDQNYQILAARTFEYDLKGNIIEDCFYGNLQGESAQIGFTEKGEKPSSFGNLWKVTYRYSDDGYNLLLEEKEPNGKSIEYAYDDETKNLKSKFILENGTIRIREFYDYDENGLVICRILDDGSTRDKDNLTSATLRKITRTTNSDVTPIGLPVRIDQLYHDFSTGEEKLFNRTFNHYGIRGELLAKYSYDNEGRYLYSHLFSYNAHGKVILEINPYGDTIERDYNENDDLIFERGFDKNSHKRFQYDFMGRLIHMEESHSDGKVFSNSFAYDRMGNKIASFDPYGNQTNYIYDELNRLIETHLPGFYNKDDQFIRPVLKQEYDIFGNIVVQTDPTGASVRKDYNVRGKPTKVFYPDGSKEHFFYNNDGSLKKSIHKNGSYSIYAHDCFQRELKHTLYSPSGELLQETSSSYNSFNKTSETDVQGIVTYYHYFSSGHLKSISKKGFLKEFEYDHCFRLAKIKEWINETTYRETLLCYDLLDRVVEERMQDQFGKTEKVLRYSYDKNGNQTEVIEGEGDISSKTINCYDSVNKLIKTIDPLGNAIHYSYNYRSRNKHGETILETVETSLSGTQIITRYTYFDKPSLVFKKNRFGQLLAEKEFFYDACYHLVSTLESVVKPDEVLTKITTEWRYDNSHRLVLQIEAFQDKDQKTTEFKYNTFGEKECLFLPTGTSIHYAYDFLGRLKSSYASDGSFSYGYEYDKSGHLIKSLDLAHGLETVRNYNESGYLVEEILGNGAKTGYSYDYLGKPICVTLPDSSSVLYTYGICQLEKVERFSKTGNKLYQHDYLSYDIKGCLLQEKQILEGNSATYRYDLKGRLIKTETESFEESIVYDASDHVKQVITNQKESSYAYDDLDQLKQESGIKNCSYTHDSLYNCLEKGDVPQEFNALNQLLKSGDTDYSYDDNGNRTKKVEGQKETHYFYDALNRLTKVTSGTNEYRYIYDFLGRRIKKLKKNNVDNTFKETHFIYAGENEVGSIKDGQLKTLRILGRGKGAEIGASIALEIADTIYIPTHTHNGHIAEIKDAKTGKTVETYSYSAFGETKIFDAEQNEIATSKNPWRFSGKRFDEETGLYYFGRRYYDPVSATWITKDPLGFEEGPNLYAYVYNNPLSNIDLYGLFSYEFNNNLNEGSSQPYNYFSSYEINKRAFVAPGRAIQFLGDHIITFPVVRDCFSTLGGAMAGDGWNWNPSSNIPHVEVFPEIGNLVLPKHSVMSLSGIMNDGVSSRAMGQFLSDQMGGVRVVQICKRTHGFAEDILDAKKLKTGVELDCVRVAADEIRKELKRIGSTGTMDIFMHSLGGCIFDKASKLLTPEELNHISVYTFGSATIIHNHHLRSFKNYISTRDPVPLIADIVGYSFAKFSTYGNTEFLTSDQYFLPEHSFLEGSCYEKQARRIGDAFKERHNIQ